MKYKNELKQIRLSNNRQILIASASVTREKNSIHSFTEIDITEPRQLLKEYYERTGKKLSFTAFIVACLAQTVKDFPECNSFIKGRKIIMLGDITISVLVERDIDNEKIPEPVAIQNANLKNIIQINDEIKNAKNLKSGKMGSLSNQTWIRFIPNFLLKTFVRLADRNIKMAKRYGKVAVTAIGMFSREPVWFVPHGSGTVLLTVGSIGSKVIEVSGEYVTREHLCLTASFDHNIIDGALAARFMNRLIGTIKNAESINFNKFNI